MPDLSYLHYNDLDSIISQFADLLPHEQSYVLEKVQEIHDEVEFPTGWEKFFGDEELQIRQIGDLEFTVSDVIDNVSTSRNVDLSRYDRDDWFPMFNTNDYTQKLAQLLHKCDSLEFLQLRAILVFKIHVNNWEIKQ